MRIASPAYSIFLNGEPFQTFNFMPELEDDIFNSILTENFGVFQDILLKSDRSEGGVLTESRSLGTTLIRMSKRIQEERQRKATGNFPMKSGFGDLKSQKWSLNLEYAALYVKSGHSCRVPQGKLIYN